MPRPKSLEKRQAMLKAARTLFLEKGYTDVSMTQISDAAGISKSTLYCHFPNKQALFMAVLKSHWNPDTFPKVDVNDTREMSIVLSELSHKVLKMLYHKDTSSFFRIMVAEMSRFPQLADAVHTGSSGPIVSNLSEYFAKQHGKSPEKAALAARYFMSLLREDPFWRTLTGFRKQYTKEQQDAYIENLVNFFTQAFKFV